MKRITLLMLAFVGSLALQAQVIKDQAPDAGSGIISDYYNLGTPIGVYSADDFELTAAQDIYHVRVYGFQSTNDLETVLAGFSLYIYADNAGVPAGNPSTSGTGLLEIINLPAGDPALDMEIVVDGDPNVYNRYIFTVDIAQANGSALNLAAGTYWICAVPHIDVDAAATTGPDRWNWIGSTQTALSKSKLIDPDNMFGAGATSWTDIESLIADTVLNALSFTLYDQNLGVVGENAPVQISLYPNPVVNVLSITLPSSVELQSATMHDLLGKQTQVSISENNSIDMSQMAAGVYILKLETNQGTMTQKVIKN